MGSEVEYYGAPAGGDTVYPQGDCDGTFGLGPAEALLNLPSCNSSMMARELQFPAHGTFPNTQVSDSLAGTPGLLAPQQPDNQCWNRTNLPGSTQFLLEHGIERPQYRSRALSLLHLPPLPEPLPLNEETLSEPTSARSEL